MALPSSNISVAMVKAELGAATNDVGQLCIHPNVNKWSKWKPVRHSSVNPLTVTQLENTGCGLSRNGMYEIEYLKPTGGATSPYRLDDFRNYNHVAIPPVNVEITSIKELSTNTVLSAPYTLIYTFVYEIKFKLPIGGEIDPSTIHPRTIRTKNTTGDGGVSLVSGIDNEVSRTSAEVFTAPQGQTILTQTLQIQPNSLLPPLRMQYCTYISETTSYMTLPYAIEDMSFHIGMTFVYINVTVSVIQVFWDAIAGQVMSTTRIVNNTGRAFTEFRIRYEYKINGGATRFNTASVPTVGTGNTNVNTPLNAGTAGTTNTYLVSVFVERLDAQLLTWQLVAQSTGATFNVNIPA